MNGKIVQVSIVFLCLYMAFMAPLVLLSPVGSSSEARELQVIDVIVREGEWILPLRNGLVPSKPPLFHWLSALVAVLTGGSALVAGRFVVLLASAVCLILTGLCARRLFLLVEDRERSLEGAAFSVLVLLLTYQFLRMAFTAQVDMLFATCIVAAMYSGIVFLSQVLAAPPFCHAVGRGSISCFWIFCGMATLTKGPLGVIIPAFTLIAVCLCTFGRSMGGRQARALLQGSWVYFVCVVPWYFLAYQAGGQEFLGRQLIFENISRLIGGEQVNSKPAWFYAETVLTKAAPWSWIVLLCFLRWLRTFVAPAGGMRWAKSALQLFPLCWFTIGLLILTIASGKRHVYVLPLLPALAILTAFFLSRFVSGRRDRIAAVLGGSPVLGVLLVVGVLLGLLCSPTLIAAIISFPIPEPVQSWFRQSAPILSVLVAVTLALQFLAWHRMRSAKLFARISVVGCILAAYMAIAIALHIGVKNSARGYEISAKKIGSVVAQDQHLAALLPRHYEYFDPLFYYLQREVELLKPAELASYLARQCQGALLATEADAQLYNLAVSGRDAIAHFAPIRFKQGDGARYGYQLFGCSSLGRPNEEQ